MLDRFTKIRIILVLCLLSIIHCPVYAQTTEMETCYRELAARFDGRDKLLQRDLNERD